MWRSEHGSVTAEFAAVIPAVLALLLVCLTGIHLASTQIRLETTAANAARSIARGESEANAAARATHIVIGATLNVFRSEGLLCARVSRPPANTVETMLSITLSATSCSLADGN